MEIKSIVICPLSFIVSICCIVITYTIQAIQTEMHFYHIICWSVNYQMALKLACGCGPPLVSINNFVIVHIDIFMLRHVYYYYQEQFAPATTHVYKSGTGLFVVELLPSWLHGSFQNHNRPG